MKDLYLIAKVLTPEVKIDQPMLYRALYKDDDGSYIFEIKKTGNKWVVISDGFKCCETDNKEYLIWNFESQLGNYLPKTLH